MADKKPEPAKKSSLKLDTGALKAVLDKASTPVKKYHALILFTLLMSVVIYSVYSVNIILQTPDDANYRAEAETKSLKTSFDQATIKKLDELRESNTNSPIELPAGRRNPFIN